GALQGASEKNGFLNRHLVLTCAEGNSLAEPETDRQEVPTGMAEALHSLYLWSGPESLLSIANPEADYKPDVLLWARNAARDCFAALENMARQYERDNPEVADYLKRCPEMALRLATIRAASRWGRGASIDLGDMEWGAGIAWKASQTLATRMQDFLPQN